MRIRRQLRIVELYAGTARSVQPFRRWSQTKIAALIDSEKHAAEVYGRNFKHDPYFTCSLTAVGGPTIERLAGGSVDILLGCPPCQGFSDVGDRNPRDPRNSHLMNFARLVGELRPLAVGMENVPLAATPNRFSRFTNAIERAGYVWTAGIVNSAVRGSCQCRHRLVFVAIRDDVNSLPVIPTPSHGDSTRRYYSYSTGTYRTIASDQVSMLGESPGARRVRLNLPFVENQLGGEEIPSVGDVLEGLPSLGSAAARRLHHFSWEHGRQVLNRMARIKEGHRWKGGEDHFAHAYGRLHRKGLARTITTYFPNPGAGRYWHPTENRSLTLREAARIQGFPDSFRFAGDPSKSAVLVGNALDSTVATTIYKVIKNALV